jgi:preprotein translocase subunit SecE
LVEQRSPKPQVAGSSPVFPAISHLEVKTFLRMENIRLYIKESIHELVNNVTWPTWGELISHTKLVLISAVIFALITILMDAIANGILSFIYNL